MSRIPGPHGRGHPSDRPDDGTLARLRTPSPGPVGLPQRPHITMQRRLRRRTPLQRFPEFKQGDTGPAVKKIQVLVNARTGTALKVDGIFGPRTRDAVLAYQRSGRLKSDGIVGIRTLSSLALSNATPTVGLSSEFRDTAQAIPVAMPSSATGPATRRAAPMPPSPGRSQNVHEWSAKDIIIEVLKRTGGHLPGELRAQWDQLVSPASREMIAGSMAIVVLAHMVGIGEVADIAMLGIGILFLGASAFEGGRELGAFMIIVAEASTDEDLDRAAEHLARAVILFGVSVVMARFMRRPRGGTDVKKVSPLSEADLAKPPPIREPLPRGPRTPEAPATPETFSFLKPKIPKGTLEPGAKFGEVSPRVNPLPESPEGFPEIDESAVNTFASTPKPEILPEGTKIYRVVGDGTNPSGSFWSRNLPDTEAGWRSDAAVKGEWNGDGGFVEYTVPKGGIPAWTGEAAPQPAGAPGYILEGGGDQVWIPPDGITPSSPQPTAWSH